MTAPIETASRKTARKGSAQGPGGLAAAQAARVGIHGGTHGSSHARELRRRPRPRALPVEIRRSVAQIAAHAALASGDRRLLGALRDQASTDARTGLANSRAFDRVLENALASRTADEPIAVLMLDLDHFKDFNDRHGHPSGDEALRTFAEVLRSCMRDGDLAARYGGEEFAVMLPRVDPAAAVTIAERIRVRTESTIVSLAPGITDRITVSIGVAAAPVQALERISLLRIADAALYQAKAGGRNRVVYLGEAAPGLEPTAAAGDASPQATLSGTSASGTNESSLTTITPSNGTSPRCRSELHPDGERITPGSVPA